MMQKHTILINLNFSGTTGNTFVATSTTLSNVGTYQANNIQGLGGGITNASNVRGFLNDEANDFIINDFFSYLTGSTTTIEFAEIYNSDQKLSDTFNDYYDSSILNNQLPGTSVINENLVNTSGATIIENGIYAYNGVAPQKGLTGITMSINNSTRLLDIYSALTTYTLEESYYIPVFIKRNHRQMARLTFEACDENVSTILNQPLGDGGLGDGKPILIDDEIIGRLPNDDLRIPNDDSQEGDSQTEPTNETIEGPAINVGNFAIRQN